MPEMPEVETIRRQIEEKMINLKIKSVEVNSVRILKNISSQEFQKEMVNNSFKEVIRRGKYLIIKLKNGKYLIFHLKLTGQLIYGEFDSDSKVIFLFENGKCLNFKDKRGFAELWFVSSLQDFLPIKKLGPEILDKEFSFEKFYSLISGKKTKIKPLLMKQDVIAGIGNIYSQEALFLAGILPSRIANQITFDEAKKLYNSLKEVLLSALQYHGSSVDTYVDLNGEKGKYADLLKVYGREGQPCLKCKTKLKKIDLAGRGTVFCPHCQK